MKNTLFTAFLLSFSLTACSDFESEKDHRDPGITVTSVEETSDYGIFVQMDDDSALLSEDSLLKKIPELDVEIHEIASQDRLELEPEWVGYESKYSLARLKDLSMKSQLWYELSQQSNISVGYIGMAPRNLFKLCQGEGHRVKGFERSKDTLYESDVVEGIIASVKKGVHYLYLPLSERELTPLTKRAVDYAQMNRIRVFDRSGNSL